MLRSEPAFAGRQKDEEGLSPFFHWKKGFRTNLRLQGTMILAMQPGNKKSQRRTCWLLFIHAL